MLAHQKQNWNWKYIEQTLLYVLAWIVQKYIVLCCNNQSPAYSSELTHYRNIPCMYMTYLFIHKTEVINTQSPLCYSAKLKMKAQNWVEGRGRNIENMMYWASKTDFKLAVSNEEKKSETDPFKMWFFNFLAK